MFASLKGIEAFAPHASIPVAIRKLDRCCAATQLLLHRYSATASPLLCCCSAIASLLLVAARRGSFHELFGANWAVSEEISL
jgi:hypothetical protein